VSDCALPIHASRAPSAYSSSAAPFCAGYVLVTCSQLRSPSTSRRTTLAISSVGTRTYRQTERQMMWAKGNVHPNQCPKHKAGIQLPIMTRKSTMQGFCTSNIYQLILFGRLWPHLCHAVALTQSNSVSLYSVIIHCDGVWYANLVRACIALANACA
jgi:hypothetical protein